MILLSIKSNDDIADEKGENDDKTVITKAIIVIILNAIIIISKL